MSVRMASQDKANPMAVAPSAEATPTSSESTVPCRNCPVRAARNPDREIQALPWSNSRGEKATSRNSTIGSTRIATTSNQNAPSGAVRNRDGTWRAAAGNRHRSRAGTVAVRSIGGADILRGYLMWESNQVFTWFSSGPQK